MSPHRSNGPASRVLRLAGVLSLVCSLSVRGDEARPPLIPLMPPGVFVHAVQALDALVMTPADAGFAKDHGKPKWTLAWVTNALNDPWMLPGVAEQLYAAAESGEAHGLWQIAGALMEVAGGTDGEESHPGSAEVSPSHAVDRWEGEPPGEEKPGFTSPSLPPELISLLDGFMGRTKTALIDLERALAGVPEEDRVYLAATLLASPFETEDVLANRDLLAAAGIPRAIQERVEADNRKLDGTEDALAWLSLAGGVDRGALLMAGRRFQEAVAWLAEEAATIEKWPEEQAHLESPLGRIVIGTRGADRFEGPALLVLDPGGDDLYRDGPGSANGLLGVPFSAIIDLGGNDRYVSPGLLGVGAALWGISVVHETGGDDVYEAAGAGFGAALFGVAWHEDFGGHDRYRGHAHGQGAGSVGFGFLVDHGGDDLYEIGFYGQGFSGVMGWGLLLDRDGHDRYFAGNIRRDHERNDDRFLSLAQGFSIGMRPHAGGGVAALIDLAGNDTYIADIYGQGVSYYYSAGFLLDGAGNDRYSIHQYGQGCGIHLSLGLLADASGDDVYSGYILAQGAAHDYAVGMLFDHAGNDTYTADHHAQGRALNNAFALLVDRSGDDAYFGRQADGTQGIGNNGGFRDYGSLALLLDLGGTDVYSGGFSNNTITLRPLYGVVYDRE